MIRALFYFILIAVLVLLAVWLSETPGEVQIDWLGYRVQTSVGVALLLAVVLVGVITALYRLYGLFIEGPRALKRMRARVRRDRGFRALNQGFVAVASGDAETARTMARKADRMLQEPPLTLLLSAQAAQLNGDETAARRFFEAMLRRPETEFLGLRGLLTQAIQDNEPVKALGYAQRAMALRPRSPWVVQTCLNLQVQLRRWVEAQSTVAASVKAKLLDGPTARQYKTAILIERSREADGEGKTDQALSLAHEAVRLSGDFVPAVMREARLLARTGHEARARKLIEKTWSKAPHRLLAETYRDIVPVTEDTAARVGRFEKLLRAQPDHPESLVALAEQEMEAERWDDARSHLMKAEAKGASRRIYRLLAELEVRQKNDSDAARDWLMKAQAAPPDPAWVCERCGAVPDIWSAVCDSCGAFNALNWTAPSSAVHLPAAQAPTPLSRPVAEEPAVIAAQ